MAEVKILSIQSDQRGGPGADRGGRSGDPHHRRRRLVRRRIPRHLARIRRLPLCAAEQHRPGDARGARPAARRGRNHPRRLAVPARFARPREAAEMVSPAPGRRQQSVARRSVGQRCDRDDIARRRQHAGNGGIRGRRHSAFRQEPAPRGHRSRGGDFRSARVPAAAAAGQDRLRRRGRRHRGRGRAPLRRARHARHRDETPAARVGRDIAGRVQPDRRGRRSRRAACRTAISSWSAASGRRRRRICSTASASP